MRLLGLGTVRFLVSRLGQTAIEPIAVAIEIRFRCFGTFGFGIKLVVEFLVQIVLLAVPALERN